MKKNQKQEKGIGIIEVIVSLAIISIAFWSFYGLALYSLLIQEQNKAKIEALNLAAEAIEAVGSIKNENWDNLLSLTPDTQYYPIISESKWILSNIEPEPIGGVYNRWVIIEKVYRDNNDNISASGTEDDQTRKITAIVEWTLRGKTNQVPLTTYFTNWKD